VRSGHLQTGYAAAEEFIDDDVVVYDRLATRAIIPFSDVTLLNPWIGNCSSSKMAGLCDYLLETVG
jgi:hypothetical protein